MNKYRLKSVVVEAEQVKKRKSVKFASNSEGWTVNVIAEPGDWLIYETGSAHPLLSTAEEFHKRYEPDDQS